MSDSFKALSALGLFASCGSDPQVRSITVDSRKVSEGALFVALQGEKIHGAAFAEHVITQGAVAILTDAKGAQSIRALNTTVPLVVSQDPRAALAHAAALWFGAQPETIVAITGTNGKTSVATFARQLWEALGHKAANIGTTGVEGAFSAPGVHTTPDPLTLHRVLSQMAQEGVSHVAMEASSHGLDQNRMDAVQLACAGFSNFTQDHLDYHETFEAYFAAKARLFADLLPKGHVAVLNLDDTDVANLKALCEAKGHELLTVGRHPDARLRILGQTFTPTGQELLFRWQDTQYSAALPLIGGFQAMNALMAAALVIGAGEEPEAVFAALPKLGTVRGRMELAAKRNNGASVFVDYAHTPDAVETALKALRPHVMGRIFAIIGAGGDRDKGKRPLMGKAAADHGDVVFVTDDNPRSEDPDAIRAAVMEGCPDARNIGDRATAIAHAVHDLQAGDALLIMGKGHETGQIVKEDILPFDDVEQASIVVQALDAASGEFGQ